MDPKVGQLINNKYRLLRLIGDGGMGSVFAAKHELLGTDVALKFLHGMLARRKGLVERFLQEAQVSARIQSPYVVKVSDVDRSSDGLAYMVMEYVQGRSLQTLYEDNYHAGRSLSYGEAFHFMMQIVDGVGAAHRKGIVHRDLKPDNVMITQDDAGNACVKLLDFGIAKLKASGEMDRGLTRPGVVMGTPEYMPPEQAFSADKVDARADIFSLGVMFFEMLAGRRPVGGDNAHAIAAQYLEGKIAQLGELKPSLDPGLVAGIHKAMSAEPQDRFDSIADFKSALAPFAPEGAPPSMAGLAPPSSEENLSLAPFAPTPVPQTIPPEQTFVGQSTPNSPAESGPAEADEDEPTSLLAANEPASSEADHDSDPSAAADRITAPESVQASEEPFVAPATSALEEDEDEDVALSEARDDPDRPSSENAEAQEADHELEDSEPPIDRTEVDPFVAPHEGNNDELSSGTVAMSQPAPTGNKTVVGDSAFSPPNFGGTAPGHNISGPNGGGMQGQPGFGPAPFPGGQPGFGPPKPQAAPRRASKRRGGGVLGTLLIAAIVSASVVGGLYAYNHAQNDDLDEPPIPVTPIATTVSPEPTATAEEPEPTSDPSADEPEPPPPPPPPPVRPPPRPTQPQPTQPQPTRPQPTQPQPTQPQPTPTRPILVIPTALPTIKFPLLLPGRPSPKSPSPKPTTKPTNKPTFPILRLPRPKKSG